MSTESNNKNSKGVDTSSKTNPQSPQHLAGHAQSYEKFTKGTVKTK